MKEILLILVSLVTLVITKPAEQDVQPSKKIVNKMDEVFCLDNVDLYFISRDESITTPSGINRLRVLRFEDGKLLLNFEQQQLVYPMLPNVTPVLHTEDGAIVLPDLREKGAAIGLRLPEHLDVVLNDIMHEGPPPPPSEDVKALLSNADAVAEGMVKQAEALKVYIEQRAAKYMTGDPAEERSHKILRSGAKGAKVVTDKMAGATGWATGLVDKLTTNLGVRAAPHIQKGTAKLVRKLAPKNENPSKKPSEVSLAGVVAFQKISKAVETSVDILTNSLKENTVQVAHHKYGTDMVDVMENGLYTVKNTAKSAIDVFGFAPTKLATRSATNVALATLRPIPPAEPTEYKCTDL